MDKSLSYLILPLRKTLSMAARMFLMNKLSLLLRSLTPGNSFKQSQRVSSFMLELLAAKFLEARNKESQSQELSSNNQKF